MQQVDATTGQGTKSRPTDHVEGRAWRRPRFLLLVALMLLVLWCVAWLTACTPEGAAGDTTTTVDGGADSGDVEGRLGADIKVGKAVINVRALQATFQPAMPAQRLSEDTPPAPGAGESFYQAYVRVENNGETPLRVDPEDFACVVGNTVLAVEPSRSGPASRSLLTNTSLDLLLTFRGPAGFQAVLLYSPPWHDGIITVSPQAEETTTTS